MIPEDEECDVCGMTMGEDLNNTLYAGERVCDSCFRMWCILGEDNAEYEYE